MFITQHQKNESTHPAQKTTTKKSHLFSLYVVLFLSIPLANSKKKWLHCLQNHFEAAHIRYATWPMNIEQHHKIFDKIIFNCCFVPTCQYLLCFFFCFTILCVWWTFILNIRRVSCYPIKYHTQESTISANLMFFTRLYRSGKDRAKFKRA